MSKNFKHAFLFSLFLSTLHCGSVYPATVTVTSSSNSGSGSLRDALDYANNHPGTTIQFSAGLGPIKLESNLPAITQSNTIITGNSPGSPQTIEGSSSSPTAVFCVLENLTGIQIFNLVITNVTAIGGTGGDGSISAGGGGMGAGAGLLVANGANVEISNVQFIDNKAKGGTGGSGERVALFVDGGSGGGGGFRGNGGQSQRVLNGTTGAGGGGGFEGNGGDSKSSGACGGAGGGGQYFNGADAEGTPGAGGGGQTGNGTSTGSGCNLGSGSSRGGSGGTTSGGGGGGAGAKYTSGTLFPTSHGNCGGHPGGPTGQAGEDSPSNSSLNGGPGGAGGNGGPGGGGGGGGAGGEAQPAGDAVAGTPESESDDLSNGAPGGGGNGGYGGGGGGAGGQNISTYGYINSDGGAGGTGGKWGGGGGASFAYGGNGGFGGGGGGGYLGVGGSGGFGGGAGGSMGGFGGATPQSSLFAGGDGGASNGNGVGGGGGAGLGGAVFVDAGGILSITDAAFSGNKAVGGPGGSGNDTKKNGKPGQGLGDDLFVLSGSTTTFASSSGTMTIPNPIVSDLGIGGGSLTTGGVIIGPGAGIVSFPNGNTYTGGTTIQGTLEVFTDTLTPGTGGGLGYYNPPTSPGNITFNGGTLVTTNTTAPNYFTTNRSVILNGSGTLSPVYASNGTFNGVISGTGPLIISGEGTVFPTAQNTYTGGTIVNGVLSINSDGNLGAPTGGLTMNAASFLIMNNNVSLNANRTVTLSGNFANFWVGSGLNSTINGQITGPGILFKNQPGNLTLTNATNNYTGGTYINGGSLTVDSASLPAANGAQLSGLLIFNQGFNGTYAGTITNFSTGTGFVTKQGTGILTLSNTNTYTGGTTIAQGGISIGSASNLGSGEVSFTGNSSLLLTGAVNLTQNLFINPGVTATIGDGGAPNTSTFSGLISGSGALNLNMTPTGRLNLANPQANTYSGGTLLNSGILGIANGNNLGTGPITFAGNSTIALMGPLETPTTAQILINGGATATVDDGGFSSVINGAITDGTPTGGALQKTGAGVLTLTGQSSYTGLTTIAQGTLAFAGNGAIPSSNYVNINAGAILDLSQINATGFSANNISGLGTIGLGNKILNVNIPFSETFAGNITDSAISGASGGSVVVNQQGTTGTYTLSGVNTYTGGTTIDGGALALTALSAFPTGGNLTINNGATLDITALAGTLPVGNLQGNGGVINLGTNALQTTITQPSVFTSVGNGINGGGIGSSFIKNGPAKLTLKGANTYVGGTTINAGTLGIFQDNSLGAISGDLNFNGGTLSVENTMTTARNYNIMAGGGNIDIPLPTTTLTLTSGLLGSGTMTKTGPGGLTLTGDGSLYNGFLNVNGGTLTANTFSLPALNGIQLNGTLIFNQGFDGTYAGVISDYLSGTGTVIKKGTGTLTLNQINPYSGGTQIAQGAISIGSAANIGTGNITFTGNGSLLLTGPVNLTQNITINQGWMGTIGDGGAANTSSISGLISGAGALQLNMVPTGRLNLTNPQPNTYSGGTFLTSGILGISNANNLGTGPIIFSGNSTLAFMSSLTLPSRTPIFIDGGATATLDDGGFSSVINAAIKDGSPVGGAFEKTGAGVLTLTAPNTYTGLTTLSQGTLAFSGDGALSPQNSILVNGGAILDISQITPSVFGAGNVNGAGTIGLGNKAINVNVPVSASFSGNITDTAISGAVGGSLIVNQKGINGIYTLSGTNSYTGETTINGGTLALTALSAFPSGGDLTINNGSTLDITALASPLSVGNLQGNGGVINLGTNSLQTTITRPSLFTSVGPGINGGVGSALIKEGPAKLTLIGANNYSSGTTINDGTLSIFRDASLGLLSGNLNINGGTLSVEDSITTSRTYNIMASGGNIDVPIPLTTLTLTSGLEGSGALIKKGLGGLVLTGDSSLFTGSATINDGFMTVNNTLPVAVTVNPAGVLKGIGPIGNSLTTLTNSGTVSPGNSIGTLAVVGNYIQTSQGRYLAEINAAGESDLITVTGTATLDGTLDVLPLQGAYFADSGIIYTIMNAAGGRIGTFSSFNVIDPQNTLKLKIIYTPTLVQLTSLTNRFFLQTQIKEHNPKEVALYLESLQYFQNGQPIPAQEDLISVIKNLAMLNSNQLVKALDQLHPAQFGEFALVNSDIRSQIATILTRRPKANICTHTFEIVQSENTSIWIEPFGLHISQKPRNDQRGFHSQTIGVLLGGDYTFDNRVLVGAALGANTTNLKWSGGVGHAKTPSAFMSLYSNWNNDWAFTEISALAGIDQFRTVRHIHFTGENRKAKSRHGGFDWGIHLGGEFELPIGIFSWRPFFNIDYDNLYQNKFSEHGANSLNLNVQGKNFGVLRTEEGFSVSKSFETTYGYFAPKAWMSVVTSAPIYNKHYSSSMQGQDKSFKIWTYHSTVNRLSPGIEIVWSANRGIILTGRFGAEFGTGIVEQKGDLRFEWDF